MALRLGHCPRSLRPTAPMQLVRFAQHAINRRFRSQVFALVRQPRHYLGGGKASIRRPVTHVENRRSFLCAQVVDRHPIARCLTRYVSHHGDQMALCFVSLSLAYGSRIAPLYGRLLSLPEQLFPSERLPLFH